MLCLQKKIKNSHSADEDSKMFSLVCVCFWFTPCWALLSEVLGFTFGAPASEMTLAMMGVASSAPAESRTAVKESKQTANS